MLQSTSRCLPVRVRFAFLHLIGLLILLSHGLHAAGQTAHFDGAQTSTVFGTSTLTGTDILSIAVDAAGDVIFTAQNPNAGLAYRTRQSAHYLPAALHLAHARRFSDGRAAAPARKMDVSGCTYNGPGSGLFIRLAGSSAIYSVGGLNAPTGLALDSSGDLYVLDAFTGAIYKYLGANGSIQVESVYGTSATLNGPSMLTQAQGNGCAGGNMATDALGNLYYTTLTGTTVEEILAVNGVIPPSPATLSLGSGFASPSGIAVDKSANIYVADAYNNAVKEIVAVNGSIPPSPTILTLGSGFNVPAAVAVDNQGDVYVSDFSNNQLKEILAVNGTIPSSPAIQVLGSYSQTQAVSLDASGNIFVGYAGATDGTVMELAPGGANFGQVNVGAAAPAIPMAFTFDTGGTIGAVSVLTQGAAGLDYTNTGTGTCSSNSSYSPGQTCTVTVAFTPGFAGTRFGAVVLKDTNGNVMATGYMQGIGIGPQVSFLPGTESVISGPSLSNPHGIGIDGSGNLYLTDDNGIEKESYSNGSYTQTTIAAGSSSLNLLTVDGAGNIYAADTYNMSVWRETPSANGYSQSIVDSGFGYPYGVAVDGAGNVYIADAYNGQVLKETLSAGGYTRSLAVGGLSNPEAVAVDGSGNLYIAEAGNGSGTLLKETLSAGAYNATTIPVTGQIGPDAIVVDGTGDIYFTDSNTYNVYKETPTPSGYVESAVVTDLHQILGPWGVAVDGSGNLYIAYLGANSVVKADFADGPALNFADTPVGTTSPDSPLAVTLANNGNAPLALEIPLSGNNPGINSNFSLDTSNPADCPMITPASSSPGTLAPGTSCLLSISYTPQQPGPNAGTLNLTDNNLNAPAPNYASQSITLNGTNTTPTFTVTPSPASLSVIQGDSISTTVTITPQAGFSVNANLSVSGLPSGVTATFSQNPTADNSTLTFTASSSAVPGSYTVTVTGTFGSETQTAVINLQVNGTPDYYLSVSTTPSYLVIGQGAAGSATITTTALHGYNSAITFSLCNPLPVGVSLTFTPSTIPAPGTGATTMTFSVGSNAGVGSDLICLEIGGTGVGEAVNFWLYVRENPVITWPSPAAITYGTALGSTQLDATANIPGTFSYSPASGTVLNAGSQTLNVAFTPTDTTNYTTATSSVNLTVNQATPAITWSAPGAITYGTALGSAQLDASSTVAGTFSYSPAAGTVLTAGQHTIAATFTPTDTTDYTTASATVTITVNQATPAISWSAPGAITYGTALGSTQLDATANVPGTFSYSPGTGAVLAAGTEILTTTFTPTDATDYNAAAASVSLTVNKATPTIAWPTPAPIVAGTPLSSTQLDATASVPGSFAYSPGLGAVMAAGSQNLTTVFTPADSADYNATSASVILTVTPAPSFTLSASPSSLTLGRGKNAQTTIAVVGQNGFQSSVTLSLSALPNGVTAGFSPNPTTGSSVLTFKSNPSAKSGTYPVTVNGVSGSLSSRSTISLTIK